MTQGRAEKKTTAKLRQVGIEPTTKRVVVHNEPLRWKRLTVAVHDKHDPAPKLKNGKRRGLNPDPAVLDAKMGVKK